MDLLKKEFFNPFNILINHRFIALIIIGLLASTSSAQEIDLRALSIQKRYDEVVSHFDTTKAPKTYKDYGYLVLAYKNLNNLNKLISTLEEASKNFPEKDVLKRELANAYEKKSLTYMDKKMATLKQDLYLKALTLLSELKDSKPTAQNLTAFIHFHLRNESYDEAAALLELYSRSYKKGVTYYSLLCEVQFKKKLYGEAVSICSKVKDKKDDALLRYVKAKENFEKVDPNSDRLISVSSRFPASASVHLEIGKRLLSEAKYEQSLHHLNKANKLEPTGEGYRMQAESEFALQNYVASLDSFRKACSTETGSKSHIHNKIRVLSKQMPKGEEIYDDFVLEISRCKHVR